MKEPGNDSLAPSMAGSESGAWHASEAATSVATSRAHPEASAVTHGVSFGSLVAVAPAMVRVFEVAGRLAQVEVPLVIEGETGTGKSALAEAIHCAGPRSNSGPCVVIDCAALSSTFADSTLFGYEGNETTSGHQPGVFEQANGGTLVLDQIDELDLDIQAKVSRVLELGRVRRLGAVYELPVDMRVIATSRVDLAEQTQSGRFRDELYYRLAITRLELPPLRERLVDVPVLLACFGERARVARTHELSSLAERLVSHRWPGNVRELKSAYERWLALGNEAFTTAGGARRPLPTAHGERRVIGVVSPARDDIMQRILELDLSLPRARQRVVAEFERRYVERVLQLHDGSIARAAEASGIARRYFRLLRARIRERSPSA